MKSGFSGLGARAPQPYRHDRGKVFPAKTFNRQDPSVFNLGVSRLIFRLCRIA
jgi:hypothetical protein